MYELYNAIEIARDCPEKIIITCILSQYDV